MPNATYTRSQLIEKLTAVFRERGFEGGTVAEIARATGLGKASLYHHFPGGKDEMVDAVTRATCVALNEQVFSQLTAADAAKPKTRIRNVLQGLDDYFAGGANNCVLAVLALGSAREQLGAFLQTQFEQWIEQLTLTLKETGLSTKVARRNARDILVRIHGAAVLSRILDDPKPFAQTVKRIIKEL